MHFIPLFFINSFSNIDIGYQVNLLFAQLILLSSKVVIFVEFTLTIKSLYEEQVEGLALCMRRT
jgi:hypothetical protein